MKTVSFKNRDIDIAGHLHLPTAFDESKTYAALVLATPGSSVKEQIGGIYAAKLAQRGFVALTFDPSYQGASGGQPRDLEDPAVRVEDLKCAADYLIQLRYIDADRIGLLGICAGGGYAIKAAQTEHRFKAVGTVVATDMGTAFREMQSRQAMLQTLEEVGKQRTIEARGGELRRDPWIPDTLRAAEDAGITDRDMLEAVEFYRESEYRHPNSTNRILYTSFGNILGFDSFQLVPDLLVQPLQVVVGGRKGATRQYETGERLYALSTSTDKDFFVVDEAGHYEMYYKPEYVNPTVDRLAKFYEKHLV